MVLGTVVSSLLPRCLEAGAGQEVESNWSTPVSGLALSYSDTQRV